MRWWMRCGVPVVAAGLLSVGCSERPSPHQTPAETPVVTQQPAFSVDPHYQSTVVEFHAAFRQGVPIAVTVDEQGHPRRGIPARFRTAVPVVLDVWSVSSALVAGALPIDPITTVRLYDHARQLLATVTLATDADRSTALHSDVRTDEGPVMERWGHWRMAAPASLQEAVRRDGGVGFLVVGTDAAERVVCVQETTEP